MSNLQKLSTSLNPRLKAITRIIELKGKELHKIVAEYNQEAVKHLLEVSEHLKNVNHNIFPKSTNLSFEHFSLTNTVQNVDIRNHVITLEKNI